MTREEVYQAWEIRAEEFARLKAHVDGATLIRQLLADLDAVARDENEDTLTLEDAARVTGYSADHLGRLIRDGKLRNHGRRHRPRVRRGDLPQKPHALRPEPPSPFLTGSKRQIAMSVVNSEPEEPR